MKDEKENVKRYIVEVITSSLLFIFCVVVIILIVFYQKRDPSLRGRDVFFMCLFLMLAAIISLVDGINHLRKRK